jgi:hypothetical protein
MTQLTFREKAINEGLITALAVGGFLIILGVVFGLTPGMPQKLLDFFGDLTGQSYPVINGDIILPAPAHPATHLDFYGAVLNFMVGIAVLQVAILATRLFVHSKIKRIAETVGNMVFWFGAAIVAYVYLLTGTLNGWFIFWAGLVIIVGVSLVVRGIIHFSMARKRSDHPCC